jgi:hypothetical protein
LWLRCDPRAASGVSPACLVRLDNLRACTAKGSQAKQGKANSTRQKPLRKAPQFEINLLAK